MPGAEVLWPIAAGGAVVAVVMGLAVLAMRVSRKRGRAERQVEIDETQGVRNEKADEIMAEHTGTPARFLARVRKHLSGGDS